MELHTWQLEICQLDPQKKVPVIQQLELGSWHIEPVICGNWNQSIQNPERVKNQSYMATRTSQISTVTSQNTVTNTSQLQLLEQGIYTPTESSFKSTSYIYANWNHKTITGTTQMATGMLDTTF